MKGKHKVIIEAERLKYEFTIKRNITVNSDKTTEMDIVSIFTGHVPPNESNANKKRFNKT